MPNQRVEEIFEGIRKNDRVLIGKGLSLIESSLDSDQEDARELLKKLIPHSGQSLRIGITGVPGSGKSTFIEAFGTALCNSGEKVAVLTIDPSSPVSKGSILGDKTRMDSLSKNKNAFIRPSPSGKMLGGISRNSRESIIILEAAGYSYVLVETVGVGQSEISVGGLVDIFLLILISGAGDELQGIKKGIMEMAQLILVNKADGKNKDAANKAKKSLENALSILYRNTPETKPAVLAVSSLEDSGMEGVRKKVEMIASELKNSGSFDENRKRQNSNWFDSEWKSQVDHFLEKIPLLKERKNQLTKDIKAGKIDPFSAADELSQEIRSRLLG